jgi:hypothetical protein
MTYQLVDYPSVTFEADGSTESFIDIRFYINGEKTTKGELKSVTGMELDMLLMSMAKGGIKVIEK